MINHISASQIHLYETCPYSWYQKYIEGLELNEVNMYYSNYGTLIHDIVENIAKDNYLAYEFAVREYDERFTSCGLPSKTAKEYYPQGKEGLSKKFEELEQLNIIGAEVSFRTEIEDVFPMVGFIDLVYRDEKDRLIVRDYKTSKVYAKSKLDKQWQPFFYAMACKELYGELPFAFEFDFVRFDKKRIILIDENYCKLQHLKLKGICKKMQRNVQPAKYSPFFCQNFCANSSGCPMFQKKYGG